MKIKVCGLCLPFQIGQFDLIGADFLGMIFYKPSPRYILNKIRLSEIQEISTQSAQKVAVFVDEDLEIMQTILAASKTTTVQLHGAESVDLCDSLKQKNYTVIKAFNVGSHQIFPQNISAYNKVCDYFLFDTQSTSKGGSGRKFNWDILFNLDIETPFFISGGIELNDLDFILSSNIINHPHFFGIDINSRFEWLPGLKKTNQVQQFIDSIKETIKN